MEHMTNEKISEAIRKVTYILISDYEPEAVDAFDEKWRKLTDVQKEPRYVLQDLEAYIKRWAIEKNIDIEPIKDRLAGYGLLIEDRWNALVRDVEIRKDWAKALEEVGNGKDLSWDISYGFSKNDISELANLHKMGKFREKIEDLLEDCNFHTECSDFIDGKYDSYIIARKAMKKDNIERLI